MVPRQRPTASAQLNGSRKGSLQWAARSLFSLATSRPDGCYRLRALLGKPIPAYYRRVPLIVHAPTWWPGHAGTHARAGEDSGISGSGIENRPYLRVSRLERFR